MHSFLLHIFNGLESFCCDKHVHKTPMRINVLAGEDRAGRGDALKTYLSMTAGLQRDSAKFFSS